MLSYDQLFVIALLRNALAGAPIPDVLEELNVSVILAYIRKNCILTTVFGGLSALPEAQNKLVREYYAAVSQSVNQGYEGTRLLEGLSSDGLDCIALKGWEMRSLYPNPAMRQMADLDVLVRPYDYARVRETLLSLGFSAHGSSESHWMHDGFNKGPITVEAHKRLTDDSGVIRDWEASMWERAMPGQLPGVWRMAPADYYVFHLVHMHKDLLDGSLGLRRIVDLWLLDQRLTDSERMQALQELSVMGIDTYAVRMSHLARVCMGEDEMDDDSEVLLEHAFNHGIYGTKASYQVARAATSSSGGLILGKMHSIVEAVFLPQSRMRAQYPELERWPVLLPICWVRRIVHYLGSGRLRQYKSMFDYNSVTEADYKKMRRVLEAAGCL